MDNLNFYKERYEDIQRAVYGYLNEVELMANQQQFLLQRFSLGTEFTVITEVREIKDDLIITGYVKTDYLEYGYQHENIKGKFVEQGKYLKELEIQVPASLFDHNLNVSQITKETYRYCTSIFAVTLKEEIHKLRVEKEAIETKIKLKEELLQQLG